MKTIKQNVYILTFAIHGHEESIIKKRLTHTRQLELYKTFLKKGGEIRFKTDDDNLFSDSLNYFKEAGFEIIWKTYDLHSENIEDNIVTEHENMFSSEGIKIKALIAKYK